MGFLSDFLRSVGINDFRQKADHERETERYTEVLTFDLGTARTNERIDLPGGWDYLGILGYNGTAGSTLIRINASTAPAIRPDQISSLVYGAGIERIYLTNTAEPGKSLEIQLGGALVAEIHPISRRVQILDASGNILNPPANVGIGVYVTQYTATSDAAAQIDSTSTPLREVTIYNSGSNNALVGNSSAQTFPLSAGASLSLQDVDISDVYVKNAAAGSNITLDVIGTEVYT